MAKKILLELPDDINDTVEEYQYAIKRRWNQGRTKHDIVIEMIQRSSEHFQNKTKQYNDEFKEYTNSAGN